MSVLARLGMKRSPGVFLSEDGVLTLANALAGVTERDRCGVEIGSR